MRNIGIAIIDDESLVRLGIKSSVAKSMAMDCRRSGQRQTGLEMIREKHPDIVLLDVIQCKVIILSDDFCFVKEAMKNGAFDYLRKMRSTARTS